MAQDPKLVEFFEEYPLMRKMEIGRTNEPYPQMHSWSRIAINRHCVTCRKETTWREIGSRDNISTADNQLRELIHYALSFHFHCASCGDFCSFFIKWEDVTKDKFKIFKIGQWPPYSIDVPSEIQEVLGEYKTLFQNGLICESQGYGIGAFAYYRRIVELIIDKMLADIRELLDEEKLKEYDETLRGFEKTIVAAKKIELVTNMLPPSLQIAGHNPLAALHSVLSVGLHELDEEDCLNLAIEIKNLLIGMYRRITLAKEDKLEFGKGLTKVQKKLDKIKEKKDKT